MIFDLRFMISARAVLVDQKTIINRKS